MKLFAPIFGTSFRIVGLKNRALLPIFESEEVLEQFMLKTNGLYDEIHTVTDLDGLVLAAKEKEVEVVLIKEVSPNTVKLIHFAPTQWWQGPCQCWTCDHIAHIITPIDQSQSQPSHGLVCSDCGSHTMFPMEVIDDDDESG